jgi:hypothetical protein
MKPTSAPDVTDSPTALPVVACSAWLECCAKLKKMSHEHKAIHEVTTEQWERAYHLGAAVALQDAQLEVLRFAIEKHSNEKADLPPR